MENTFVDSTDKEDDFAYEFAYLPKSVTEGCSVDEDHRWTSYWWKNRRWSIRYDFGGEWERTQKRVGKTQNQMSHDAALAHIHYLEEQDDA